MMLWVIIFIQHLVASCAHMCDSEVGLLDGLSHAPVQAKKGWENVTSHELYELFGSEAYKGVQQLRTERGLEDVMVATKATLALSEGLLQTERRLAKEAQKIFQQNIEFLCKNQCRLVWCSDFQELYDLAAII